jgi:lysyl-tRNA synthetase class 2
MTDWRPTSGPETAGRRAERIAAARYFFAKRGVLEVDVPALSRFEVSDPNIDSLEVTAAIAGPSTLYLATSPEYAMKRLLAAGYPDIYAIARVFRDGELGRHHEPEFTLIEWYRQDFGLDEMAAETCEFVAAILERPALANNPVQLRYREAFLAATGIDPLAASAAELAALADADASLVEALGDNRDAWLDLLMSTRITAGFPDDRLTVVTHYPASQAALARLDANDLTVALRFEVFLGAMELANGYVELSDADEQRQRFEKELDLRRAAGRRAAPIDESLLAALEHGLPDVAGVAVGFERLHMLYEGTGSIADVITFSFGTQR